MISKVLQDIILRLPTDGTRSHLSNRKRPQHLRFTKGFPYHFTVYCAHRYPVMLQDLEAAGISFMPIGQAPGTDRPPRHFGGDRFLKRQQATDWDSIRLHRSWGIQVYTGMPSARDGAPWHDIDFKYEALCAAPDAVLACVQALVDTVTNPLLTMSESGGLRFLVGYRDTCTRILSKHDCMSMNRLLQKILTNTKHILKSWVKKDTVAGMRTMKFYLGIY